MAAAAVRAMLMHVPVPGPARDALFRRLSEPSRTYHGLQHVAALWSRHLALGRDTEVSAARASRLAASVIAFHDAVYDPRRQDNEQRSAALWRQSACPGADMPAADAEWVAGTIEATEDHMRVPDASDASPEGRLRLWVLDLDLTPLGEPPAAFRRNTALLRAEYRHLDDQSWNRRRLNFLRRIAAAPRIYRSPLIAAAFEGQAQANLAQEIACIES